MKSKITNTLQIQVGLQAGGTSILWNIPSHWAGGKKRGKPHPGSLSFHHITCTNISLAK